MTAPTIINNLPKGNVKAPQGAIMKINTGEQLHNANFDNNTEFVLEFTPDNLDQNGNPIYVRNGITEDEVVIGNSQLGIKIPYSNTGKAIDSQTYLYTVNDDKNFYNFFINTIRDSISILDENGNSYRWYDEKNSKGLRLTSLSDDSYRGSGVVPGEIFYLKNNLSFGSMGSFEFAAGCIYLSGTNLNVKFTTLLINNHNNNSSTALEFSQGQINIIDNNNFKYPLNKFVYLGKSDNNDLIQLFFYNNLLFMTDTGVTGSGLEETRSFSNIDLNYMNYLFALSYSNNRFNAIGYGDTHLLKTGSTTLQYNPDSSNKPKTNTIIFFPMVKN